MLNFISNSVENKKAIIFIHGIASTSEIFKNQIEIFKKDYSVISIDLPGYGKSPESKEVSITNYAKIIYKFFGLLDKFASHLDRIFFPKKKKKK